LVNAAGVRSKNSKAVEQIDFMSRLNKYLAFESIRKPSKKRDVIPWKYFVLQNGDD